MNKEFNFAKCVMAHKDMETFDSLVREAKTTIDKFIKGYWIYGLMQEKREGSDSGGDMNTTNATDAMR